MTFDKDFDRDDEVDGQTSTGLEGAGQRGENVARQCAQPPGPCSSLGSASLATPPPEVVALMSRLTALGWQAEAIPAHAEGQVSEQVAEALHTRPSVPWHRPAVVAVVPAPQTGKLERTLTLDSWWIAARPQLCAVANGTGGTIVPTLDDPDDREEWDVFLAAHWAQRLRPPDASHRRPSWTPPADGR